MKDEELIKRLNAIEVRVKDIPTESTGCLIFAIFILVVLIFLRG